jgi:transcriptional regulator with XRE-family HTH domain
MANSERVEGIQDLVRHRLRELRRQRGLTLGAVAAAAAMDVSTLSRLESGRRRLSLDHLPRLTRALGVSSDELLAPLHQPDPRIRASGRTYQGLTRWSLSCHGPAAGLHAFKMRISDQPRLST